MTIIEAKKSDAEHKSKDSTDDAWRIRILKECRGVWKRRKEGRKGGKRSDGLFRAIVRCQSRHVVGTLSWKNFVAIRVLGAAWSPTNWRAFWRKLTWRHLNRAYSQVRWSQPWTSHDESAEVRELSQHRHSVIGLQRKESRKWIRWKTSYLCRRDYNHWISSQWSHHPLALAEIARCFSQIYAGRRLYAVYRLTLMKYILAAAWTVLSFDWIQCKVQLIE